MKIDAEGRLVIEVDEEVVTPKGGTVSGDIGHFLYLHPGCTLAEIIEGLKETRWIRTPEYVGEILSEYIDAHHVVYTDGRYDMTDLGTASFISGWW